MSYLLLAGLAKWAEHTGKPWQSAGIYASLFVLMGLIFQGDGFSAVLVSGLAAFVGAGLLFTLLNRFQDNVLMWVLVFAAGLLIFAAAPMAVRKFWL